MDKKNLPLSLRDLTTAQKVIMDDLERLYSSDSEDENANIIVEDLECNLSAIETMISDKVASINHIQQVLNYDIAYLETMKKRIESAIRSKKSQDAFLESYLIEQMQFSGIEKIDRAECRITLCRGRDSLLITNEHLVPDIYKETVITRPIKKDELKKALQAGATMEGAILRKKPYLIRK